MDFKIIKLNLSKVTHVWRILIKNATKNEQRKSAQIVQTMKNTHIDTASYTKSLQKHDISINGQTTKITFNGNYGHALIYNISIYAFGGVLC